MLYYISTSRELWLTIFSFFFFFFEFIYCPSKATDIVGVLQARYEVHINN